MSIKTLCVFCGASPGSSTVYAEGARRLADAMFEANITLTYGGGKVGLMGIIADRMLQLGGKVIGVIPTFLKDKEVAHQQLTKLHVVNTMRERKQKLLEISDAFILLPGGIGSLDEFFEMITLSQLGQHNKPRGILNTANYYDSLIKFLDFSVKEKFWNQPNRERVLIHENPSQLLQQLQHYQAPALSRWVDLEKA